MTLIEPILQLMRFLGRPAHKAPLTLLFASAVVGLVFWLELPGLSLAGRINLAIFVVAATFWMSELVPLYVTSFIILALEIVVLLPALEQQGIDADARAFMSPFFSDIILLFLGGLLLAQAGSKYRLDSWFAALILRWIGSRPSSVLLGMMATSAVLSMWMSNTATTAMMLIIAIAISRTLHKSSGFKKALFLGIPFASNLGGMGTPIGTPPNAIAIAYLQRNGVEVTFLEWMLASFPLLLILLLLLWFLLLKSFPATEEKITFEGSTNFPSGWKAKATIAIFALSVLLWLSGNLHGLSSGLVALIALVLLLSFQILDSKDFRGISWDVLFLVGGGLSLGVAMQKSGFSEWLTQIFALDQFGFAAILVIFVISGAVLTTFMSNTATANMIIPVAVAMPGEWQPLAVATAMAVSTSMALPVSTPPNAIAYYSGEVELKEMFRVGAAISIASAVLVILAADFYWRWLRIFE